MIDLEQQLRAELKRVTDEVQPGQLRPLRAPERGRRRWLLPAGAVLAGGAIVAVAALLAGTAPGPRPAASATGAAAGAGLPPYYVVATQSASAGPVQVVVRDSANGRETGAITVPNAAGHWASLAGSGDGRHFVIEAGEASSVRFYRLTLSPEGQPALQLAATYPYASMLLGEGQLALSPDGTEIAVSQTAVGACPSAGCNDFQVQVVNLDTGKIRNWNEYLPGSIFPRYEPGALNWASDTALMFTVTRTNSQDSPGPASVTIRTLDTAAPGNRVVTSAPIPLPATTLGSDVRLTPTDGGSELIGTSCVDSRSWTASALHGTGIARVVELSAAGGWAVHEYRTQATNFRWPAREQLAFDGSCSVESVDPTGQNALVLAFGLGRFHDGAYIALPGFQLYLADGDPEAKAAW